MKKFLTAVAILACTGTLALAGPNAGGTILVHTNDTPVPPEATYVDGGLTACDAANAMAPLYNQVMWYAYAAFPQVASPRLSVVTFGCDYDPNYTGVLWTATYSDATVIFYDAGGSAPWPQTGSGAAVLFATTLTATVNEIYCFAGYSYGGVFGLVPHPDQGGFFADDGNPSVLDPIADYGTLGFGEPGYVACPVEPLPGACCYPDGLCEFVPEVQCGGVFLGEDVPCDPNPCPQPGACCFADGSCQFLLEADCTAAGGVQWISGVPCDPNPCVVPTDNTSWGQIKNIYR